MAIELHLQKTTKAPWGFTLAGGVEYEVPLTVIKVVENSIAENAGMQAGDVVVRINDIPVSGLTHPEAHDILLAANNDFIMAVRRGDLTHLPPRLLLYETSVENAEDVANLCADKGLASKNVDNDLNITDEEIVNIIGEQVQFSSQKSTVKNNIELRQVQETRMEVKEIEEHSVETKEVSEIQKQSEVSKLILSDELDQKLEKKWSTFLQKPKNPKPKPKIAKVEQKAPPYRVIIKKQPKKNEQIPKEISCSDTDKNEQNLDSEVKLPDDEKDERMDDPGAENSETENKGLDENQNTITIGDDVKIESEDEDLVEQQAESTSDDIEIVDAPTPEKRLSINLEEQLALVQRQLQELAQLPSTIQETLNTVTQQLSELVLAQHSQAQEVEAKVTTEEETTEEYLEISEGHEGNVLSVLEEEQSEHLDDETVQELHEDMVKNESEDEQALFEELEKQMEEEEQRRLEELEMRRIEQERIQKKDKERRSSQPHTPLQRPIVLPGGRKWCNPDDAISKIRRPSMTDEKIANTINMFSEVIVGRTMGINFLKYQPPPKNLEHLQKSAVYRLVHDIEPPPKGVIARDAKILAEQDYYTDKQDETNISS